MKKEKAPTREGVLCKHDGTTTKYLVNGNCVACCKARRRNEYAGEIEARDKERQAILDAQPRMQILITKPCRVPVLYQLPIPPKTIANTRWL